ncbi:hypothetical protein ACXET9_01850 [Brachybacterium sp. DNPG3]
MTDRTYRSGVSTVFLGIGCALILLGVLGFPVLGIALALASGDASVLWVMLASPIAVIAGGGMAFAGWRRTVTVGADGVAWRTALSAGGAVPYAQIHQVQVPLGNEGIGAPRGVRLLLRDGSSVAVRSLRLSSGDGGYYADGKYMQAAQAIVEAHHRWWTVNGPSRRG